MSNTAVTCQQLTIRKNNNVLLNHVSFAVKPGVICGLLGPSGAGKTTLMRVLVGLQGYRDGKVSVLGSQPGSQHNRQRIGYVTQAPSIYADLTVIQNLHYFAQLVGVKTTTVKQVLAKVHLQPQAKQLVSTLSGGQKTRASLAVALLGDPELLVLDEPTVGLDPLLRQDLWQLFKDMAEAGKTLIISSHVMDEAAHCEQLLLLREGELLWSDSQAELLKATYQTDVETAFIKLIRGEKS